MKRSYTRPSETDPGDRQSGAYAPFGSLLATLILLAVPVGLYWGIRYAAGEFPLQGSLITIALPGAVGGLLKALRERSIALPHWRPLRGGSMDPGLFADLWLGVAGAYAIFLLVPGDLAFAPGAAPPASQPSDPALWALVEITALAMIGGFAASSIGARAVPRRVGRCEDRPPASEGLGNNGGLSRAASAMSSSAAVPGAPAMGVAEAYSGATAGYSGAERPGERVADRGTERSPAGAGSAVNPPLEFHRALCNIRLDSNFAARPSQRSAPEIREAILADLRSCAHDPFTAGLVRDEPIVQSWLRLNHAPPV